MNNNSAPSISASLLEELLTAPRSSTAPLPPLLQELLDAPPSAPEPTTDAPPSAPEPTTDDPPVIDIASPAHDNDSEYEMVTISTAHPNFNAQNPEHLHEMTSNKLPPSPIDLATLPFPLLVPLSLLSNPRPVSPFPPSPQPASPRLLASPSPPASPLPPATPQLPERRRTIKRLRLNTPYTVLTWHKQHWTLYNHERTELIKIMLPKKIRPTKKQKLHHLFENNLTLRITKINGRLHITIEP